jgi:hypothetical protein
VVRIHSGRPISAAGCLRGAASAARRGILPAGWPLRSGTITGNSSASAELAQRSQASGCCRRTAWSTGTELNNDEGPVDWDTIAAVVTANFEATGQWFL